MRCLLDFEQNRDAENFIKVYASATKEFLSYLNFSNIVFLRKIFNLYKKVCIFKEEMKINNRVNIMRWNCYIFM